MDIEWLLLLTLVIVIHEAGHYVFARVYGVQVMRASLFFNPFVTLLKYNPLTGRLDFVSKKHYLTLTSRDGLREATGELSLSLLSIRVSKPAGMVVVWNMETGDFREAKALEIKATIMGDPEPAPAKPWRHTQYCIGWLPFGGYVTLRNDRSRAGILSKKNHQQFIINFGGILFNIISMLMALFAIRLCAYNAYDIHAIIPRLWDFAYLSFAIILLNILPLPGLDGGGMLMCILNYVLPRNAQAIMRIVNSLLGIVVFVWIISTWFRRSFGFEIRFYEFVRDCFYMLASVIIG